MGARVEKIDEGICGIVEGPVNVYVVDDPKDGPTLIDAGLPGWERRILGLLDSMGHRPEELRRILVTHADVDHVGSLAALVAATKAEVAAGAETARLLASGSPPPHIGFPMRLPVALMSRVVGPRPPVGRTLADGELLDGHGGLRALATPGHTPDHFAYYLETSGVLFVGDLARNLRGLEPYPRFVWDREAQEASMRIVEALRPRIVCPGHGRVWREGDPVRSLLAR